MRSFLFAMFMQTLRTYQTPAMVQSAVTCCCLSFLFSKKDTENARLSHPFHEYSVNPNPVEIKDYTYQKVISTWTGRAKAEENRLIDQKLCHRLFLSVI